MRAGARRRIAAVLLGTLISACAPLPQYTSLPVVQYPSANFSDRRPSFVILHHTSDANAGQALGTLTRPAAEVSAHYLVARDGTLYYLVDELKRAWHAGPAYWGAGLDMNSASIGIELDNDGAEPYAGAQIEVLLQLLADLKERYRIPAANFIGHGDIAPGRKVDPGLNFPWRRLADRGFGLWCEPPFEAVPPGLDAGTLLGALGYDVSNNEAAISAFNRHFAGIESRRLAEAERSRLYCLVVRKRQGQGELPR
jgi:N-acetylmuramoyl-L-alanine amidase